MSKLYHEIMEKLEVSDEMRTRILNSISKQTTNSSAKPFSILRFQKIASIAACAAFLLLAGTVTKNAFFPSYPDSEQEMAGAVYGMEECTSAAELSQKAGFDIKDISGEYIPFEVESVSYTWCWNEFAQIIYEGTGDRLIYRKTEGTEDISGDYNEYGQVLERIVNGVEITIKGNNDKYYLATWHTNNYSYSISIDNGISLESLSDIVQNCTD